MKASYLRHFIARAAFPMACFVATTALAQSGDSGLPRHKHAPLAPGFSSGQVIKLRGAPDSRIERELKGEVIWIYGHEQVVLRDGYVQRLSGNLAAAESKNGDAAGHGTRNSHRPFRALAPFPDVPPSEILREVMSAYGEEGGTPAAPTPQPPPAGISPLAPQIERPDAMMGLRERMQPLQQLLNREDMKEEAIE